MHRSGWGFCRKVIKDAQILLTSFAFVCIASFHCGINILITFGTILTVQKDILAYLDLKDYNLRSLIQSDVH
jgi:hypothetical protein